LASALVILGNRRANIRLDGEGVEHCPFPAHASTNPPPVEPVRHHLPTFLVQA
jgi:hypothetical protein